MEDVDENLDRECVDRETDVTFCSIGCDPAPSGVYDRIAGRYNCISFGLWFG